MAAKRHPPTPPQRRGHAPKHRQRGPRHASAATNTVPPAMGHFVPDGTTTTRTTSGELQLVDPRRPDRQRYAWRHGDTTCRRCGATLSPNQQEAREHVRRHDTAP